MTVNNSTVLSMSVHANMPRNGGTDMIAARLLQLPLDLGGGIWYNCGK